VTDARDLVIDALVDAEAELLERLATYRTLAHEAVHSLHEVTADRDRLRAQHHQLLDEYRALLRQQATAA